MIDIEDFGKLVAEKFHELGLAVQPVDLQLKPTGPDTDDTPHTVVQAFLKAEDPTLALHRTLLPAHILRPRPTGDWTVTHAPTGLSVTRWIGRMVDAIDLMLALLTDQRINWQAALDTSMTEHARNEYLDLLARRVQHVRSGFRAHQGIFSEHG